MLKTSDILPYISWYDVFCSMCLSCRGGSDRHQEGRLRATGRDHLQRHSLHHDLLPQLLFTPCRQQHVGLTINPSLSSSYSIFSCSHHSVCVYTWWWRSVSGGLGKDCVVSPLFGVRLWLETCQRQARWRHPDLSIFKRRALNTIGERFTMDTVLDNK